jgi:hypothetical protein
MKDVNPSEDRTYSGEGPVISSQRPKPLGHGSPLYGSESATAFLYMFTHFFSSDLERVREGLADKFGYAIQFTVQFSFCFAIGFWKGWKLSFVIMSLSPLLAIGAAFKSKVNSITSSRPFPSNFG